MTEIKLKSKIATINIADETKIVFPDKYNSIAIRTDSEIGISPLPNKNIGDENVLRCKANESTVFSDVYNAYIYLIGTGTVEIILGNNFNFNPFKVVGGSGGGGSTPILINKTITENGTYNASEDSADGYSRVTVDVETPFAFNYVDNNTGLIFLSQYSEFTGHIYNYPLNIIAGEDITIELCLKADLGREHYGRYFDSGDIIIADCPDNGTYYLEFSMDNQWQIEYDKGDRIELPQGTEHTLTFRITSGGMDIFIDGEFYLFTDKINSSMYHSAARTAFWLMDSSAANRAVNGKIYAFRIYGRALTNLEIAYNHATDLKIIELNQ